MDPITIAMLGSTVLGGIGSMQANKLNQQISLLNYYEQVAQRRQQQQEARRQQSDARLGATDAAGNRTYFVPGVGWVTDLTDAQQNLQTLTEQEQARQLTEEAGRNERVSARANTRRNREDTLATEAERELRATRRPDEGALRQLFLARGAETRNAAADRAGEAVARQNVRAGGRNAAALVQGSRAASDAQAARQAGVEAELASRQTADQEFDHNRDRASKMFDYFRRASTAGTNAPTGFMPTAPQQGNTGIADAAMLSSFKPVMQDFQQPNNALADTAFNLASILNTQKQTQLNNDLYTELRKRQGSNAGTIFG